MYGVKVFCVKVTDCECFHGSDPASGRRDDVRVQGAQPGGRGGHTVRQVTIATWLPMCLYHRFYKIITFTDYHNIK